jgi:hypothetical protein
MSTMWPKGLIVGFALAATGLAWIALMASIGQGAQSLAVPSAIVVAVEISLALAGVVLYVMVTRLAMGWALGFPRDRSFVEWLRLFFGLDADKGDIFEPRGTRPGQSADEARELFQQALQATERAVQLSRTLPSVLLFEQMPTAEAAALRDALRAYLEEASESTSAAEAELRGVVRQLRESASERARSRKVLREAAKVMAKMDLALLEAKVADPDLQKELRLRWAQQRVVSESLLAEYVKLARARLEMHEASERLDRTLRESASVEAKTR